jgi:hypothetical protein
MRERVFEAKCSDLGRIPSSKSCSRHKPDAFTLMQDQEERVTSLVDMSRVFRRMSPNDLQILAAIMLNERKTRKAGFSFMQKVYIRVQGAGGRNYLSNFAAGFILDADREWVRVVSETAKTAVMLPNEKNSNSLFTVEQFRPIRTEIFEKKNFVDPEIALGEEKIQRSIINLDQADDRGLFDTPISSRRKIKKTKEKDDLVSFVAKLNRGVMRTRKAEQIDEEITLTW